MARDLDNFRVLLVLAIATMGLAAYVNFIAPEPPRELQEMLLWRDYGAVTPGFIAYYWHWVEFGLYAISLVTMCQPHSQRPGHARRRGKRKAEACIRL